MSFCTVQTKQDLVPSQSLPTNLVAADINDIVRTINTLLVPIIDNTAVEYSKDALNTLYSGPNGAAGQIILCPVIGFQYVKLSNDSNGDWSFQSYSIVS